MNFNVSNNNSRLIDRLEKTVQVGKISHAYIFEGPANIDKVAFARSFIKGVLCPNGKGENCGCCSICDKIDHGNHGDIAYIEKDGLSVKDAAIELIQEKINVKPIGERNIVVISDCDTMTPRAQNRLLKTLEEPPGNSMLILLSENMENLAQTILSRCVKFRIEAGEQDISDGRAEKIVKMALEGELFYVLCEEIEDYSKDREKIEILIDSMEQVYRKYITVTYKKISRYKFDKIYDNIKDIEDARMQLRQGMAAVYALKNLLLKLSN